MTQATNELDPVCGMAVDPSTAEVVELNGEAYYFCEPVCAEIFRDEPLRWIEPAPEQA